MNGYQLSSFAISTWIWLLGKQWAYQIVKTHSYPYLFFFSAIISEIYHPEELAVARLSEAFGASPAKYIDFQQDNAAAASKTTNLLLSTVFMAIMAALF